jgi:hypothetical protein
MRKAKRRYESDPEFALRVGRPLMETSWGIMLLAGHKRGPGEDVMDLEERADDLARTIRSRLTDLLKRDPVVTAHALAKYVRRLPKMLAEVWSGRMVLPGARNLTMPEMKKQAEMLRQRAVFDAMLAKFEEGKEERLLEAAERETRGSTVFGFRRSPRTTNGLRMRKVISGSDGRICSRPKGVQEGCANCTPLQRLVNTGATGVARRTTKGSQVCHLGSRRRLLSLTNQHEQGSMRGRNATDLLERDGHHQQGLNTAIISKG